MNSITLTTETEDDYFLGKMLEITIKTYENQDKNKLLN